MNGHHLPGIALLAAVAALVESIPGLDFVIQMGWLGALVGSIVSYIRWRQDPRFEPWPLVTAMTLFFVLLALFFELLSALG